MIIGFYGFPSNVNSFSVTVFITVTNSRDKRLVLAPRVIIDADR